MRLTLRILLCLAMAVLTTVSVEGRVLYDSEGFEGDRYQLGPVRSAGPWKAGVAQPAARMVDLGDDTFGRVMRVFSPQAPANANYVLSFEPQHEGVLVISFDFWTNTNHRSLYLLVTPPNTSAQGVFYESAASLCWGVNAGRVQHYSNRWWDVGAFELERWHHIDAVVYLSGAKAGTMDFNIDGGPFSAVDVPWRNRMKLSPDYPLGEVWFMGFGRSASQAGGATERYFQIDNVVVTHLPAMSVDSDDDDTGNQTP